jgi:uncharacterized protein (DUF302 family)
MEFDRYVIRQRLDASPADAEERIRAALADEGFGVLTEIDVRETLRAKLDVEVAPYRILGACKPAYAQQAIELDPAIGGLLPCNVVVRAHPEGGSELIAVDPNAMMALSDVEELTAIAGQVREELVRAVSAATSA